MDVDPSDTCSIQIEIYHIKLIQFLCELSNDSLHLF